MLEGGKVEAVACTCRLHVALCLSAFLCSPPPTLDHTAVSNMKNMNTRESLDKIRTTILENLAAMPPAPSAQMAPVPPKAEQVGRWRVCCIDRCILDCADECPRLVPGQQPPRGPPALPCTYAPCSSNRCLSINPAYHCCSRSCLKRSWRCGAAALPTTTAECSAITT